MINTKEDTVKRTSKTPIFLSVMLVVMIMVSLYCFNSIAEIGGEALIDGYRQSYETERKNIYDEIYKRFYERAEREYHVSNRVSINIGELKEKADLEVLCISDVEYVIEDGNENSENITSWIEVPGEGIYNVNLQEAEFIVDDRRGYVLVRLPNPELKNVHIVYDEIKELLFKNDLINESYKDGEELAQKQLNSADMLIKKEFVSNQNYYSNAKSAAKTMVTCLVRKLNPEVENLKVEVEFISDEKDN